jgi:hypothetical protein
VLDEVRNPGDKMISERLAREIWAAWALVQHLAEKPKTMRFLSLCLHERLPHLTLARCEHLARLIRNPGRGWVSAHVSVDEARAIAEEIGWI